MQQAAGDRRDDLQNQLYDLYGPRLENHIREKSLRICQKIQTLASLVLKLFPPAGSLTTAKENFGQSF